MLNTPRNDGGEPNGTVGKYVTIINVLYEFSSVAIQYANSTINGNEAIKRLSKSTLQAAGGMAVQHGCMTVAKQVGSSLGPIGQFAATVAGNMVGQWLSEKLFEFLAYLFQPNPEDGYRNACRELGVEPTDSKKTIKRAFIQCHPDKGSRLTSEQFQKKHMAYELIKAIRIQRGTWFEEEDMN
eukprot:gnl/TRDRNA2_/TRDRNA2_188543_c0_seq1.p1 gnl/TRDRNA2_/TRDRNA2_188543_c0~~gnl/TRDRNA2_/TRDRNA2_188543_c0_seq1.p1  ORF type:complete len:183 (+),score=24.50 gnl/TRDRNA2_/TRDRNA2_188543_c0_seq1:81-629(+)